MKGIWMCVCGIHPTKSERKGYWRNGVTQFPNKTIYLRISWNILEYLTIFWDNSTWIWWNSPQKKWWDPSGTLCTAGRFTHMQKKWWVGDTWGCWILFFFLISVIHVWSCLLLQHCFNPLWSSRIIQDPNLCDRWGSPGSTRKCYLLPSPESPKRTHGLGEKSTIYGP